MEGVKASYLTKPTSRKEPSRTAMLLASSDLSQMVVSLDSVTFSPPPLPGYLWKGYHQVGKLQLEEFGTEPFRATMGFPSSPA
jgi:hypothetical protein